MSEIWLFEMKTLKSHQTSTVKIFFFNILKINDFWYMAHKCGSYREYKI
jgi:hypothetical protein